MVAEEAKLSLGSIAESNLDLVEDDEEFYEQIEAPKFVDFTVPNHYGPDDRYWFCLRVGCDQKHEEEMDSEAIYKQFVLRVMAARSPNVRLHKALHRSASSKNTKCPLSAPPKPSKSLLPRLAVVSSLSKRIGDDDIVKAKHQTKVVSSTPKAKGKQVSSKYLTTPSYKKCPPNPKSFQSVGKQHKSPTTTTALMLPKSRIVAKALSFQTPKKVLILKKPMELHTTPVANLCEGMKNLEIITSQRNRVLGYSSKTPNTKPLGNNSQKLTRQKDYNLEKPRNKMSVQRPRTHNDLDTNKSSSRPIKHNTDSVSINASERDKGCVHNPRIAISSKENDGIEENEREYTGTERAGCDESVGTECDEKENASTIDENRCANNISNQTGILVLGIHSSEGKKDTRNAAYKNMMKGSVAGMKMVKPKPTNPKPFRLRTDERRILKENNSDRKHDEVLLPAKEVSTLSRRKDGDFQGQQEDNQKGCTRIVFAARTPEHRMVRKTPDSIKSHSSKHKDVKHVTAHQSNTRRDLKNILRKSTFSSRMHSMASKLTPPVKQVSSNTGKKSAPERKFNAATSMKVQ